MPDRTRPAKTHAFFGKGPPPGQSVPPEQPSHDLEVFVDEVSDQLAAEYERIRRRAPEDPGTAGDEGEENWRDLFEQWLPGEFTVVTKGRILGANGQASPQVDVIVLRPGYPRSLRNKKTYLAGGVVAAFECKLTLRPHHVAEAANAARAIRSLAEDREGTPYDELHSPIAFGLLAHAAELGKSPIERLDALLAHELEVDGHPRDVLDAVCVAQTACWTSMNVLLPRPAAIDDELWGRMRQLHQLEEAGSIRANYVRWLPWPGNELPPRPLYVLIGHLLRRAAWEFPVYQPLANYWTMSQVHGSGGGAVASRSWPFTILSEPVRRGVTEGRLISGVRWSRWGVGDY